MSLGYDKENPLFALTTQVGGASSTYMTDYYYQNTGNRIALVGGYYSNNAHAGLWFWNMSNTSSNTAYNIGARLLKYQD